MKFIEIFGFVMSVAHGICGSLQRPPPDGEEAAGMRDPGFWPVGGAKARPFLSGVPRAKQVEGVIRPGFLPGGREAKGQNEPRIEDLPTRGSRRSLPQVRMFPMSCADPYEENSGIGHTVAKNRRAVRGWEFRG